MPSIASRAATQLVSPHPDLAARMRQALRQSRDAAPASIAELLTLREPQRLGFNDGVLRPGSEFAPGTLTPEVRWAASTRQLRGTINVAVVLVDFNDEPIQADPGHFQSLFFSVGVLATGSVKEYYAEVSNGLVDIDGKVVGPYRLPRDMTDYANGASGIGSAEPNAATMAADAAPLADVDIDFAAYDNDKDGYADAYVVVHAGRGAEQTGQKTDIWSHKSVLTSAYSSDDGTRVYAYLTVPEDCRMGVCAHELGHLLFGWPDLYDIDQSSSGLGAFCLMAAGSWNDNGDVPAHPSAWCKASQGWITVTNQVVAQTISIPDVKDDHTAFRLWTGGTESTEYFLLENRQKQGFDRFLPAEGLLAYHVDDAQTSNSDESHYWVGLLQADGLAELESGQSEGDAGDPYPGTSGNTELIESSTPSTQSYSGASTGVSVTQISNSGPQMSADVSVLG